LQAFYGAFIQINANFIVYLHRFFIELFWLKKPTEVGCELFMVSDRPLIEFLGNLSTNDAVALVDRFEAANH